MPPTLETTRYAGIYKRGSKYVVRYRLAGKYKAESCATLEEARKLKRSRESARDRGELDQISESQVRLADYALEWTDRYQGNGRRGFTDETRDEYRRDIERYVIPRLGDLKLSAVRHRDVADWVAWLCDGKAQAKRKAKEKGSLKVGEPINLSDATVRRILCPLRACFATARREGLRRDNPCSDVPLPSRPKIEAPDGEDRKALTRAELAAFLLVTPPKWKLFFRTLAATGLRWGEITALQWHDLEIDGSNPRLNVRRAMARNQPKGGPPKFKAPKSKYGKRTIPLVANLARELREHRASVNPDGAELVFPSLNGSPLDHSNTFRRVLRVAGGEAGVPWIGFHTFRHTCASMAFDAGRSIKQVQRWLGHHSPAFTLETYVHLLDEGVGEGIDLAAELPESECILSPDPRELSGTEPDWHPAEPAETSQIPDSAAVHAA